MPSDKASLPIVLSASRRTDLVACYPDYLVERLAEWPPEKVHTVVIWTKDPANMIRPGPLCECLRQYDQLYVHLTITGLGHTLLEPRIPPCQEVAARVPDLVALAGSPERISWRFDPLVRATGHGQTFDNSGKFPEIAAALQPSGIRTCRTSFVEPYRKVERRMRAQGFQLQVHTPEERRHLGGELTARAAGFGMHLHFCAMEGFPRSRCIDGDLLTRLHPSGRACSTRKARGQRTLCGCTESRDIGWYSQTCPNGCLYCYAEPQIE